MHTKWRIPFPKQRSGSCHCMLNSMCCTFESVVSVSLAENLVSCRWKAGKWGLSCGAFLSVFFFSFFAPLLPLRICVSVCMPLWLTRYFVIYGKIEMIAAHEYVFWLISLSHSHTHSGAFSLSLSRCLPSNVFIAHEQCMYFWQKPASNTQKPIYLAQPSAFLMNRQNKFTLMRFRFVSFSNKNNWSVCALNLAKDSK